MAAIKPYTIDVPDSAVQRLQEKLRLATLPKHQIEDANWIYGTPLYPYSLPYHLRFNTDASS